MNPADLETLLHDVSAHRVSPADAFARLKTLPFEDLGFASVDHHRALRCGFPEVVYGGGKTPAQIAAIVASIAARDQGVLVTRAEPAAFEAVRAQQPDALYEEAARCIVLARRPPVPLPGRAVVVCAGTSDLPVAEEAAVTLSFFGGTVDRVCDAGVAGLHRLLGRLPLIRRADVVIAVAGMEGALPSVLGGLVDVPTIAVPTSVGYGASFGGVAALLAMLNACASGIGVVNIDNGFGAAYLAALILRSKTRGAAPEP